MRLRRMGFITFACMALFLAGSLCTAAQAQTAQPAAKTQSHPAKSTAKAKAPSSNAVRDMRGTISAINLQYNTVVVRVPLTGDQLLTVGGPVAQGAMLIKNGKKVDLSAFNVGDPVIVKWRKTKDTLPILGLRAAT